MHYHLPECKLLPTYPSVPKYAPQYLWLLFKLTEQNNISNSKFCKLHILIRIIITHTQLMHHYSSSTDYKSFLSVLMHVRQTVSWTVKRKQQRRSPKIITQRVSKPFGAHTASKETLHEKWKTFPLSLRPVFISAEMLNVFCSECMSPRPI